MKKQEIEEARKKEISKIERAILRVCKTQKENGLSKENLIVYTSIRYSCLYKNTMFISDYNLALKRASRKLDLSNYKI